MGILKKKSGRGTLSNYSLVQCCGQARGKQEYKHVKRQSQAVWKIMTVCLFLCMLLCGCAKGRPDLVIGEEAPAGTGYITEDMGAALPAGSGPAGNDGISDGVSEKNSGRESSGKGNPTGQGGSAAQGDAEQDNSAPERCLYVYVCGAVTQPGVVELPEGSRAFDAVRAAGGMTEEADLAYVNLAEKVTDGEKLYVPTVEEAATMESGTREEESGLVNINTADAAALCTLPGIGESRAADIIAYREAHGAFGSIEDIMKVPGIKDAAFRKIRDRISVG